MSVNLRFRRDSSIKNISVSHRGRQVIHDSLLCKKSQITRPLYFTFDEMGRLIEVKKDSVTVEVYSYDNNGNRASATVNGVSTIASYTLDDQLVVYGDNSYRYDENGYLVSIAELN